MVLLVAAAIGAFAWWFGWLGMLPQPRGLRCEACLERIKEARLEGDADTFTRTAWIITNEKLFREASPEEMIRILGSPDDDMDGDPRILRWSLGPSYHFLVQVRGEEVIDAYWESRKW